MTAEPLEAATMANADRPQPSRIFIAIKIVAAIADALAQMARGLERFQVRLVAPVDIHLTLVPPWNELSIPNAVEKLRRVVNTFDPFVLTFRHVGYGPDPKRPRLLWAECAAGREIEELRDALLLAFGQADERPFRPHVTLARLRENGAVIARKHPIDQDILLVQRIEFVETMQSPPPGGSGYRVLASLRLGGNAEGTPSAAAARY
jgi:2'-5' RNA ligase